MPSTGQAISQNTAAADLTAQIAFNNVQAGRVLKSSAGYSWLPVLEFGRDAAVYRPHAPVEGLSVTKAAPALIQNPEYADALEKYRIISGAPITPVTTLITDPIYADPIYKIESSKIKMRNAPVIPATVTGISYE